MVYRHRPITRFVAATCSFSERVRRCSKPGSRLIASRLAQRSCVLPQLVIKSIIIKAAHVLTDAVRVARGISFPLCVTALLEPPPGPQCVDEGSSQNTENDGGGGHFLTTSAVVARNRP